ncbi:MAG: hypothetical protein HC894_32060 [Microcoleus sp. SM1_3_4]|nr:hypothetical protein [Microcoleus sp. SM1_3_4]
MQTATNLPTLTVQLSPEDSDRLLAEAKRRQIDPNSLAQMLLHESLTKLKPVSAADIEALENCTIFGKKPK